MSTRTPELRQLTAARIAAVITAATVVQHNVDPATAARIVTETKQALVSVQFSRVARENRSHAALFLAHGDLDVIVYTLDPVQLDTLIEGMLEALLSDLPWLSTFEAVPSIVTDYEYAPAGAVDLAAARIRITAQWSEDYPPMSTEAVDLAAIAFTTRIGRTVGPETIFVEVDDTNGDIQVDDVVLQVNEDAVVYDAKSDLSGSQNPAGDAIQLDEAAVETEGFPKYTPPQERTA